VLFTDAMAGIKKGQTRSLPDSKNGSSSGSDSSSNSVAEEERLRRLFVSCDHDKDGYIDRLVITSFLGEFCHKIVQNFLNPVVSFVILFPFYSLAI
jgi:hypothetical protein